jgi:hypothetical protein
MRLEERHIDDAEFIAAQDDMMRQIREAARVPGMGSHRQASSHSASFLGQGVVASSQTLPNPDGSGRLLWIPGVDPWATPGYYFGRKPLPHQFEERDF